ncbi:uncharacterized protein LOC120836955 [Ixodes scapularis]|uniref:uncharacterized protein LOC120836955 n=1 Tax=Ixodes scapularis TaxID=6945 RepID=UPI001A9E4D28|nr:uncharacterized protein LOC120836955 [Ixodes scapularis]
MAVAINKNLLADKLGSRNLGTIVNWSLTYFVTNVNERDDYVTVKKTTSVDKLECSPGTHGTNCSLSCECLHGEICHHADGTCFCTGRHRGRLCDQLAPKVLHSEESEVKLGESTLVSCTVEASPAPVVQLYYQESGKTLSKVSVEALGGDLYKATAPLSDTLKDGMQTFRCRARNEYGFDVGTVQVDVVGMKRDCSSERVYERRECLRTCSNGHTRKVASRSFKLQIHKCMGASACRIK